MPACDSRYRQSGAPLTAWLLTIVLTLCYTLSIVDRSVIAFLVVDIKRDLHIDDFELGLVQGLAFSVFYALAGVPLGLAIDRYERKRVIAAALFGWSTMTMLSGAAYNFLTLAVARIGVGVGEASLTPGSYSLMSDAFPRRQFAMASAIYSLGVPLAAACAAALSGYVLSDADASGTIAVPLFGRLQAWRAAFVLAGMPGVLMGFVMLSMRVPARTVSPKVSVSGNGAIAFLRKNWRTHVIYIVTVMLSTLINASFSAWSPASLRQAFGWSSAQVSTSLGSIGLACGVAGSVLGGFLSTWVIRRGRTDWILVIALGGVIGTALCGILGLVAHSGIGFVAVVAVAGLISPLMLMMSPTLLQIITPPELRGRITALFLLINIGIGMGLGPTLVGALSSHGARLPVALGAVVLAASCIAIGGYIYLLRPLGRYLESLPPSMS